MVAKNYTKFMYKKLFSLSVLALSLTTMSAKNEVVDTINTEVLEAVSVISTRSQASNSLSASNIKAEKLSEQNIGQNLPFLLSTMPSTVATSDDGLGIGYTYFRIRGTDHTRVNMTVNGVPLNDSESQTVFWVNMTDFASSLSDIQVQRGVGTSTNGSAAFGASVNMQTDKVAKSPYATLGFNGGMYNTFREIAKVGTGLMPSGFSFDAKFSKVNSDGYLERAFSDLYSYSASASYFSEKSMVKLLWFGGKEKTYMAWDGVSKEQMQQNHRFNPAGADYDNSGNIVGYYDNQTDNYQQNHLQLHFSHTFLPDLSMNLALHYTQGSGYYEQLKDNAKLSKYNLPEVAGIKKCDIIRQKHLDNHFYGGTWSLNFTPKRYQIYFGGAVNNYIGDHFGKVLFARNYPLEVKDFEYYRGQGRKLDANTYLKAHCSPIKPLSLQVDLQYRFVDYTIDGINDEDLKPIFINRKYHFFNPKAGIYFAEKSHNAYFTFAVANREPARSNFTESGEKEAPTPERLFDFELGYNYATNRFSVGANIYFMQYKNQLVLTGKYSDVGAYLTKNVKDSYRRGIEIMGGVQILHWMRLDANLTLSQNKILNFTDWFDVYDANGEWVDNVEVEIGKTDISFSPSIMANAILGFDYKGFEADLQSSFVGRQFLDNTMNADASLPAYNQTNLRLAYSMPIRQVVRNITFSVQANNIFNSLFASNGGSYSAFYGTTEFKKQNLTPTPWFYAQAGFNIHAGVKVDF